jgi:hypothetical protein
MMRKALGVGIVIGLAILGLGASPLAVPGEGESTSLITASMESAAALTEPATLVLFSIGLVLVASRLRRRQL